MRQNKHRGSPVNESMERSKISAAPEAGVAPWWGRKHRFMVLAKPKTNGADMRARPTYQNEQILEINSTHK